MISTASAAVCESVETGEKNAVAQSMVLYPLSMSLVLQPYYIIRAAGSQHSNPVH